MPASAVISALAEMGPSALPARAWSLAEARAYCRRLARTHYENFQVASWLLPRPLRPHFYAVYAYCRWADDLADEVHNPAESLRLLDWWQEQLDACYAGQARHPVFVALRETVRDCAVPRQPFADLLDAFRQDQATTRYETLDEVLAYCRRSADPVGRIVLHLGGAFDDRRAALSDHVCTGLQLANFCQDVANDWDRGRVYLPQRDCRRFGYGEADFSNRTVNEPFRGLLAWFATAAEERLRAGLPLVERLPGKLRGDVWLFAQGGLKILANVRGANYDVWSRRPKVSKWDRLWLLAGCLRRSLRSRGATA